MARYRSPGGQGPTPADEDALDDASSPAGVAYRLPPPPSALRGRVVVAAVAAGAVVAAAQTLHVGAAAGATDVTPLANGQSMAVKAEMGGMGGLTLSPEVLPLPKNADPALEVQKLAKSERLNTQQSAKEVEANRAKFIKPAQGTFTSGFGSRWGQMHYGVDIANAIGTPILSAADGVVIEAGPASGFGLWIRVQLTDGTINVYGHVDKILCKTGQRVKAGEQIATMGNRGFSTGPHLHFEVWNADGKKINPLPWLNNKGITL